MANPKPASRLYFVSGKTLDVVEVLIKVCPGTQPPWTATVTEPSGAKHWVNLQHVERIEVLT